MIVKYLTQKDAIYLHDRQIDLFGGASGIRDMGQLDSALFRPQTGYYKGLIEEAAALWESLAQNHPFVDGNKRTALAVTDVFLQINGYKLTCEDDALWPFIIGLHEAGDFTFDRLTAWLRNNTKEMT